MPVSGRGTENVNSDVDALLVSRPLTRVLAPVDVTWSNSIVEAFWRSLRHPWLHLYRPTTKAEVEVETLVARYVDDHNCIIPHAAFDGQTPDETYFGTAPSLPDDVAAGRIEAKRVRVITNRALSWGVYVPASTPHPRDGPQTLAE